MALGALKTTTRGGPWSQSSYAMQARLTTALSGSNNDLVYTSKATGTGTNSIRVRYVVAGNNTALSVSVSSNDITVNVATDGSGVATSTAAQVRTAVLASTAAMALLESVENATGNNGTGVVAAMAYTALSGGAANDWARGSGGWRRVGSRGRGYATF